ncbi:FAD-dependent monooxygenase [Actinokineospora sp. PR83]|uniref:FAD-dependent monooxygenase n=1 Tax=Actinokineospora sp. PR83 TaxID=2884908 RepID=UPI001F3A1A08|nr:FAD-dependent monooxygenase [Actinokineospora sp. PR83]MCG8916375.1 FAD-dependent monooxygenase [Actinokineospora sp. PR83]
MTRVLVSGASVAGPTLAFWLRHHGFEVTVVEKAGSVRGGGYPIDIRGTAVEVVDRMGLLPRVAAKHIDTRQLTFVDVGGHEVGTIRPEEVTGGVEGRDLELPRGDLTDVLYDAVRDRVDFRFDDSIAALTEHDSGVDVVFRGGDRATFDLVIGADGLHSGTRRLAFGPEAHYLRHLGYCFAGFTMPNHLGLAHGGITWNTPGKAGVLYAAGASDRLHAFLTFTSPEPPAGAHRDPAAQRDLVAAEFAGHGWEIPRMVAAMRAADDLYFDVVSQIHLPAWSTGRVALVGDAAYAPSFLSGQGSSIALVGAYVLAGELATHADHTEAFAAYERGLRGFVERNQALAAGGAPTLIPRTAEELRLRDAALADPTLLPGRTSREVTTALALADYAA